jgi:hypothetical protein
LRNGVKRTGKGWQHWDRFDRVFAVWQLKQTLKDPTLLTSPSPSTLSYSSSSSSSPEATSIHPSDFRRIDIIVVPFLEWPFALLSWTGSKVLMLPPFTPTGRRGNIDIEALYFD